MNGITVQGIANLVADPKVTTTAGGVTIANTRLAFNYSFRRKGVTDLQSKPLFIASAAFGTRAEKMSTLKKGSQVLVEGRLDQENWEKDGTKHTTYKIILDSVRVLNQPKAKV